jgi:hypothetical protein
MSEYVLPQSQVFQLFSKLPSSSVQNLNAFVFGPQYQVLRYADSAERQLCLLGDYAAGDYSYPSKAQGADVDTDSVKVWLDDVKARYFRGSGVAAVKTDTDLNKLRFAGLVLAGANRSAGFKRDVIAGDIVDWTVGSDTGTARVTALEAEAVAAVTSAASSGSVASAGDDISAGEDLVTPNESNTKAFDGDNTEIFSLDANYDYGTADVSAGLVSRGFVIEITTGGAKGVAKARVSDSVGTFTRTNVPIEDAGSDDGRIYLGANVYVNFDAGTEDGVFVVGDKYEVALDTNYAVVSNAAASGTYTGTQDTVYRAYVERGGWLTRAADVVDGLVAPAVDLSLDVSIASWHGGDIDDEYVLRCTTPGELGTARFALSSLTGDSQTDIDFSNSGNSISLGSRGLTGAVTDAGATAFVAGDSWVIRVRACRPLVTITDSAGIDYGTRAVISAAVDIDLGSRGVKLNFPSNGNTQGVAATNGSLVRYDSFTVTATAATTGDVKTLVLSSALPTGTTTGDSVDVDLSLRAYDVELPAVNTDTLDTYWTPGDLVITLGSGVSIQDDSWGSQGTDDWLPVVSADVYVEYRALMASDANEIRSVESLSEVSGLGVISPVNPLAQAVYNAVLNSGGRPVYYAGVASDDLTGFNTVLGIAEHRSDLYFMAPVTQDTGVLAAVVSHCDAMSNENNKKWRLAIVGNAVPSVVEVYGDGYTATVSELGSTGNYVVVDFVAGDPTCIADVEPGDMLRLGYDVDGNYQEYLVDSVETDTQVVLVSGPAAAITTAVKTEVWHPLTTDETADHVAAVSESYMNRRVFNVFPDQLTGSNSELQSAEYGAAALAGLASSVPPQQGLTNITVSGFTDAGEIYRRYSKTQLNRMAGAGTLILMQDQAGGQVYVRHQVSTATSEQVLLTREMSITKNFDSVSYYFDSRTTSLIGRYNVTPEFLDTLRTIIEDGIMYLASFTSVGLLGPQLLLEDSLGNATEIQSLRQHPTLKDTVIIELNAVFPAPLNNIKFYITAQ